MKSQNIGSNFTQTGPAFNTKPGARTNQFASLPSDSFTKSETGFQGIDLNKAASILARTNSLKGNQVWKRKTDHRFTSSPVQGNSNNVYIGSINDVNYENSNRLLALDANSGETKWEFKTNGGCNSAVTVGPDETVYACCYKTGIFAVDGNTGRKKWNFNEDGSGFGMTPTLGSDGTLYAGSPNGKVYAIDGKTGNKLWDFKTGNEVYSAPLLGKDDTVFVGSYDKKFYALDRKTGKEKWSVDTGDRMFADPVYGQDDTVYVSSGNKILALDGKDGAEKWRFETNGDAGTAILGKDGTLYVGEWNGGVYAIDTKSHKQLWKKEFKGMTREKPALSPDDKLFITAGGKLQVLDAKTGNSSWEFDSEEKQSFGGLSLGSDGKAYLATEDKSIFAVVYDLEDFLNSEKQTASSENVTGGKDNQPSETKPMEIKVGDGFVDIGGVKLNVNK